ncbi:MAG: DUF2249 domain-containing protein [Flavobacteriaceae bacterium]|nr:DUF2249 domain-containing protein [Flavobacteriaceae bacterium]
MQKNKTITIDCREMQPPDPLVKVLQAADVLNDDEKIIMIHRHEPCMLLKQLKERNLSYEVEKKADESVLIHIWKEVVPNV